MKCWRHSSTRRCGSGSAGERGRVAVLDLARARTRRFDAVFLLGLEEGTLPRRGNPSPFLDDDVRGALDRDAHARLVRPDAVERERYLFYTACTRATRRLTLVREAATDEGSPREPSPFWDEVVALFDPDDVRALDAAAAALATHLGAGGGADRARAAAGTRPACGDRARRRAGAGGRERLGAAARARSRRVHARDEAHAPARARGALRKVAVQRHRARALRRLLVGLVLRAVDLAAPDRQEGRRDAAWLGRAHDPAPLLCRPAAGDRERHASTRAASTTHSSSSASAWTARSEA